MNYNWNWGIFFAESPEGSVTYLETLLQGLGWTLATSLFAWLIAFTAGILVGVARTQPIKPVSRLGEAYQELFRNIPLLVQIFLWFFVLPELVPTAWGNWLKQLPPFYTAVIAIGLYTSSRVANTVYSGIVTLPKGQKMAGTALGFTLAQTYRYVLLPLALRNLIPPLTSEMLGTVKNSSVALTIGLLELTARTRAMQEYSFQVFEAFSAATLLYLIVNYLIACAMRLVERAAAYPGIMASSGK